MTVLPQISNGARVFVIGKDPLVSQALSKLLALDPDLNVLGESPTIGTAPIAQLRPDVVVLDTAGRPSDAAGTRAFLQRVAPNAKVALLDELRSMSVGAMLDTVKGMGPQGGSSEHPRHLAAIPLSGPLSGSHDTSTLSDRELEVVRLVAEGLSNKEISTRLSLSDKTVKNHISHILAKMNLTARTQVAVYAIRAGLV
ncbi:MAG TPA: response regulator transcription factor [Candidatus Baltobacteraceae bacterium]|jgi:DNA-binding NarL/FixJ family response regulator